jgi:ribosomal protein L29
MKASDIRKMTTDEINKKISELKQTVVLLRSKQRLRHLTVGFLSYISLPK